jgi:hypothetical protein
MPSPTVRVLSADDVARLAKSAFGSSVSVATSMPLTGGGFASVWSVHLSNGRHVVLKTAPPADAKLLEYESGLLRAEFEYFTLVAQRAPGVPVPVVLRHGEDAVLGQWLFTEALPGSALATLRERDPHLDDALSPARRAIPAVRDRLDGPSTAQRMALDRMCLDVQPQAHDPAPLSDLTVAGEAELLEQGFWPGMEIRAPLRRAALDLLGVGLNDATTGGAHGIQCG